MPQQVRLPRSGLPASVMSHRSCHSGPHGWRLSAAARPRGGSTGTFLPLAYVLSGAVREGENVRPARTHRRRRPPDGQGVSGPWNRRDETREERQTPHDGWRASVRTSKRRGQDAREPVRIGFVKRPHVVAVQVEHAPDHAPRASHGYDDLGPVTRVARDVLIPQLPHVWHHQRAARLNALPACAVQPDRRAGRLVPMGTQVQPLAIRADV